MGKNSKQERCISTTMPLGEVLVILFPPPHRNAPQSYTPKIDSGVTDVTDSPTHATPRHAAPSPPPACSWLGLAGGGGGGHDTPSPPRLDLALTHAVRSFCLHPPNRNATQSHTPKIDSGVTDVTDSPMHATPWHAASSPAPACSWLGLAGGGHDPLPPARPHATVTVHARLTGAMRLFCFHPHPHAP